MILKITITLFLILIYCLIISSSLNTNKEDDRKLDRILATIGTLCIILLLPFSIYSIFHYIKI
jgi:hypothetical protein